MPCYAVMKARRKASLSAKKADEAAAAAEKGLPNGWRVVEHATEGGRSIRTFLSPANTKHRSLKSALAAAVDGPPASPIAKKQAKKLAKKK